MAGAKEIRTKIASVKSTQKITKAMQMVAAAKLRRAPEAATAARPYAERMGRVLTNLGARITDSSAASPILVGTGKDDVHLFVVATSDKGLAGAFNTNIVRLARKRAEELKGQGRTVKFYTIGKKAGMASPASSAMTSSKASNPAIWASSALMPSRSGPTI